MSNLINSLLDTIGGGGGEVYKGTWNAATNTPTITSSVGTTGWYYIVSDAGTTNIDGINSWALGDKIVFNGLVWQKIPEPASSIIVNSSLTGNGLIDNPVGLNLSNSNTWTADQATTGKFGAGTATPSEKLEVAGNVLISQSSANPTLSIKNSSDAIKVQFSPQGNSYINGGGLGLGVTAPQASIEISDGKMVLASLWKVMKSISTTDDGTAVISSIGRNGWGFCNIGANQEYAFFCFSTTAVTLLQNSTNVANSDTDGKLCIYYNGTALTIKNRLGSTLTIRYEVNYSA